MKLTAKEVAEKVGVSPATVSLVINNKPGVGDEKRKEILNKIIESGGEHLLKKKYEKDNPNKGNIGFVVFKGIGKIVEESPFFNYILDGITMKVNEYGYVLNFMQINKSMNIDRQEEILRSCGCKGLLIFGVEMQKEDLEIFKESNLPFVVIDNSFQESDIDSVVINNFLGVSKAVNHLYDKGHRKIGYIKSKERINSFEERYNAFVKKMKDISIDESSIEIIELNYSEKEIRNGAAAYFNNKDNVLSTAYFAENDFLACNAMIGIQKVGFKIPEDISIIGFDNRPITEMMEPKLTTIGVPKDIFGPEAVNLLISRLEIGRKQSLKVMLGSDLIVRNSVRNKIK